MSFNKYQWIKSVEDEIFDQSENDIIRTEEDAWELVYSMIEDAVVYTYDCFEIVKALNYYDWTHSELPVNDIHQAAYNALSDFAIENIKIEKNLYDVQ